MFPSKRRPRRYPGQAEAISKRGAAAAAGTRGNDAKLKDPKVTPTGGDTVLELGLGHGRRTGRDISHHQQRDLPTHDKETES
jgi:hypothetical protein